VSLKRRVRTLFCCFVLQFGTLVGVPMRPEQIQELMRTLNTPKIAHINPETHPDGDQPDPGDPEST
jgi:hypothetical protein